MDEQPVTGPAGEAAAPASRTDDAAIPDDESGPPDPAGPAAADTGAAVPSGPPPDRIRPGGPAGGPGPGRPAAAGESGPPRGAVYRAVSAQAHFPVGLQARVGLTVTDADTAQAVGSGDVPVLGTPRLLALAEAASVAATARHLPSGMTTVGAQMSVTHLAPTPVGRTVAAVASLTAVSGRRLCFDVSVTDGPTVVARGRIERVLVDRHAFVDSAFAAR